MRLPAGTRLGPYDIQTALGAGGMGEVYLARDTNLARDVAIKVLPEAFAHDSERLARFEREARTLAALNHPNIATVHGLESVSSTSSGHVVRALVMELVDGPTVAELIGGLARSRSAAHRTTDCRRPRSRARAGHRPSRSEAGQRQGSARRHGQGPRLRSRQGRRSRHARVSRQGRRCRRRSPRRP